MKSNISGSNSSKKASSKKAKGLTLSTSHNFPLSAQISAIEKGFSTELLKKGTPALVSIVIQLMQELEDMKLPKPTLKVCKQKVISLFDIKLSEVLNEQYQTFLQKPDATELEALAIITKPSFIAGIVEDPQYPDYIKKSVSKSIPKFLEKKLEELEITHNEFEEYIKDPSAQRMIQLLEEPETQNIVEDPEKNVPDSTTKKSSIKQIKAKKAKSKKIEVISEEKITKTTKTSFFEQVKSFTNNFKFLAQQEYSELSDRHLGKFEDYESYIKFKTFQTYFSKYLEKSQKTEIDAITQLLQSKPDELKSIDPSLVDILEERKKVIENQKEIEIY